LFVLVSGYVC